MGKKWFIIEGNIGCGKSTLLTKLKEVYDIEIIQEPVDKWLEIKDENNKNLLDYFYTDMERNSYMFQTMVFKTRIEALDEPQVKNFRFSERSIWTDRYVFGKMCLEGKKMNSIETSCYKYWFNFLENKFNPNPNGIIYIRCTPEKCLERINNRGRNEETKIKLEYLQKLHDSHELWFNNWTKTPVLIIDNNEDNDWDNVLNKIKKFVSYNSYDIDEYQYSYFT
jgi:deoxyadenosine/deoxycytidine kinase